MKPRFWLPAALEERNKLSGFLLSVCSCRCCPSVGPFLSIFFPIVLFSVSIYFFFVCVLLPASSLVLARSSIQTRSCKASAMRRLFSYPLRESKETEITVASITHRQWRQSTTTSCRRRTHGTLYKCIRLCGSQTATTCPISTTNHIT